jgi:tyrosine-protein phosphatase YwqE
MRDLGIKNFVTTPHVMEELWDNNSDEIELKVKELTEKLKEVGLLDVRMKAAAEYMLDHRFSERLETEELRTLKDRYLLIEMSYLSVPINLYEVLFRLQVKNYLPVLAHPERYNTFHRDFKQYYKLKDAGCLFQLNLLSLTPYYGKQVQSIASKLIDENLIDFVGTDTHHERHLEQLEKLMDYKKYQKIVPIMQKNSLFAF